MDKLTKFTKLVIVLWNILIYYVNARSNVRHMSNAINWFEANTECGGTGLEHNSDKLKNSDIPVESEFWIGQAVYSELTPWIEVFGCIRSINTSINVFKVESIGKCQQKCHAEELFGYKYEGLQMNCVCFTKVIPTELNSACQTTRDFLIHRYYSGDIKDDLVDPGNCVTLCCGDCHAKQNNMLVGRNCDAADADIVGRCGQYAQWGQNYNNSRKGCWQRNKLLLSPTFCTSRTNPFLFNGIKAWTNVFREKFDVVKYGSHQHPVLCYKGILHKRVNETKQIDIYKGNCNSEVKWLICKDTNTVQHQPTALSFHVTSFNRESNKRETRSTLIGNAPDVKPITVSLQQSTNRQITEKIMKKDNNTHTYTGVIVGGTIGVFLLLIIPATLWVCRKRSFWLFKEKNKSMDKTEEFSQTPNNNLQNVSASYVEPISNQTYEIATNLSSTYAVVNKLTKSAKTFTEKDDTYMDSQDGQYDQLNDIQKRKIIMERNLYDSHEGMRDQNDPTYDISKFSSHGSSHEVTDVYNHSFLGTQNDGEYDYSSTYRNDLTN